MNSSKIQSIQKTGSLADNLKALGLYIRKVRTSKGISIEELAQASFLKPDTIRKLEAGTKLPIYDSNFASMETTLGIRRNTLVNLANEHRGYLVQFVELYKNQIIAFLDALRIYQPDEMDRILNQAIHDWDLKIKRKEDTQNMTRTTSKTIKPAVKAAPKRVVKTAPTKRATAPRSTAKPAVSRSNGSAVKAAPRRAR